MNNNMAVMAIGFAAQAFFSARIIVQWVMSERARRVLSPSLFWVLSLFGSYLLCIYGWLRSDFAIVFGQFISYYIYLWNIRVKGLWASVPLIVQAVVMITPVAAAATIAFGSDGWYARFFDNGDVPMWLLIYGSAGQMLFTLRFIYQYLYSRARHKSQLPIGFWIISLTGALLIVTYAIVRKDIVLIVGQSFGIVAYTRNICIIHNERKRNQ
ncbi:MAG: lipid-A-disaccharide synthase N-terminal domain-containing protein [Prevotellaceae bacterium]|nr:lipid-A-disaccharide synthase N-terminal domain-containing protein [Prevotellaceae bacterium]